MSKKKTTFDVWIVESNTVYKEVPYAVVTDWLQQGRLLEDDKAKPSGTPDWQRLGEVMQMQAFLPKPEPFRADDQAEALQDVAVDFAYKRPHDDEDEDVDMIPLIDVSLVLLVFFMLSAAASTVAANMVNTPAVYNGLMADNAEGLHIDVTLDDEKTPVFALRVGTRPAEPDEKDLRSMLAVLNRLEARLLKTTGPVDLQINADKGVVGKVTRDLTLGLRREPFRSRIPGASYGVTGRKE
jgi:biopolymer transport protein ExbD